MITNVLQPIECYIETQFYAKQVLVPVYPFYPNFLGRIKEREQMLRTLHFQKLV